MKLIRLESDSVVTKSEFTNNMAIPLEVSSNSKVALKTLSMQFDAPPIVIDSTNNRLTVQTNATTSTLLSITLARRSYESANELCKEIAFKLNALMQSNDETGIDMSSAGMEWMATGTTDAQNNITITISFDRSDNVVIVPTDVDLLAMAIDGDTFIKNGSDNNDFNARLEVDKLISNGGWSYQITPVTYGTEDIALSVWRYYLQSGYRVITNGVQVTNGLYEFWYDGKWNETSIPVKATDVVTVSKKLLTGYDTRIHYNVFDGTDNFFENGDNSTELLDSTNNALVLEIGNDTGKIGFQNLAYYPTTTQTTNNGVSVQKKANEVLHVVKNKNLKATASNVQIILDPGLARLLGYAPAKLTQNAKSFAFVAQSHVTTNIFNNDIVVELIQLPLNGYDHSVKKTKNMIMVITSGSLNSSTKATGTEQYELSYTDNFPTYVSLQNNKQATTYSQLTVRVTSENRTLVTNGKMSCLLLFKDDSDY